MKRFLTCSQHKRGGMNDEAYAKFLEHSKTTHAMGEIQKTNNEVTELLNHSLHTIL